MSANATIRNGTAADVDAVLALNQDEAKWTSNMTRAGMEALVGYACLFLVVEVDGAPAGFVIMIASDSAYPNENLAWFRERYAGFWYVDRIVISKACAGAGMGRKLYERCFEAARQNGVDQVVCEYSTEPMNEGSAAFHRAMGFTAVGRKTDIANGGKQVSMQSRPL